MKHKYFLLTILLLIYASIPLQRVAAEITIEAEDATTQTTKTTDKDDITFEASISSEFGDFGFYLIQIIPLTTGVRSGVKMVGEERAGLLSLAYNWSTVRG